LTRILKLTDDSPWIWSLLGIVGLCLALSVSRGRLDLGSLVGSIAPAAFLALASIGQNFAIATGGGNIDLSIPNVITLSAFVTISFVGGSDTWAVQGLLLGAGLGVAVGMGNALLIVTLRLPAIIATLAVGYVLNTFTLLINRELATNQVAPILRWLGAGRIGPIPLIALIALLVAICASVTFGNLGLGRMLLAASQNRRAARLAGIPISLITVTAFALSGALAGLVGVLLAAYSGGAFLDMGSDYLLKSVGAVVVGGSPAFGGRVTIFGTLCGALLLTLLGITMQLVGLQAGAQEIVQGGVIVAILAINGMRSRAQLMFR
jgi:ribose transport system permease protein